MHDVTSMSQKSFRRLGHILIRVTVGLSVLRFRLIGRAAFLASIQPYFNLDSFSSEDILAGSPPDL
jgi:hypothetical protein